MLTQAHCRRRILCRKRLPGVAAPNEMLAELQDELLQGEWLSSRCLLAKDVGVGN